MFNSSIANQFWKDSWDAYSHADGSLGRTGTIASIEAQGLAYDAIISAIRWREVVAAAPGGEIPQTSWLSELACRLRDSVLTNYWVEDPGVTGGGFFALATDHDVQGRVRPLGVLTSNMGHLLMSDLLDEPELLSMRQQIIESLFDPILFCATGFRTLSTREKRFRATGYHNGNSWPWDSYRVARGLERWKYQRLAREIRERIVATCNGVGFFPEFVAVGPDDTPFLASRIVDVMDPSGRLNRIEQPPQLMQAWTVAAIAAIKRQRAEAAGQWSAGARLEDHESSILLRLGLIDRV